MYLVCPPEHPLAGRVDVTQKDLAGVRLMHTQGSDIMLVRTGKGMQAARPVLYAAGVVDSGFEVANLATLAGLAASGFGVCLVPETALPQFSLLPTSAVRISPKMMTRPVYCVHQRGRTPSHAARGLMDLVREHRPGTARQAMGRQ